MRRIESSNSRLLRLAGAAAYLGVGITTVYQLVERGVLQPITLPGIRGPRFDRADLELLVETAKRRGAASEAQPAEHA